MGEPQKRPVNLRERFNTTRGLPENEEDSRQLRRLQPVCNQLD